MANNNTKSKRLKLAKEIGKKRSERRRQEAEQARRRQGGTK